jgi:hypothetical protein
LDSSGINTFVHSRGGKICLGYPILWEAIEAEPDVAVNERIQPLSQ